MKSTLVSRLAFVCVVPTLLFCGLSLAGCDGGSSSSSTVNRFAGSYGGTFNDTTLMQSGTLSGTVTNNGTFTGAIVNNTIVASANFSGSIDNSGNVTFSYAYTPNQTYTGTGTVSVNPQNHLVGNIRTSTNGAFLGTSALDLTKQ